MTASTALRRLAALRLTYGGDQAATRLALVRYLARAPLPSARAVARLHELLAFLHAYPDDEDVFAAVERALRAFGGRGDVRRFRNDLFDSGIAGTDIFYRFPAPTARWLASRCGSSLHLDWDEIDVGRLARHLPSLVSPIEVPGYDEGPTPPRAWLATLAGPGGTDAAFLIRRFSSRRREPLLSDRLYDELDLMIRIAPGPRTPTRTAVRYDRVRFVPKTSPLRLSRPDLRAEALRPPRRIRTVGRPEARRLIDMAIAAMVTRGRDLGEFTEGEPRDVRLLEDEDGLAFACVGVTPARRLPLEAVYGFLTLRNGVPVGYALASALFGSCEVAFNMFETFRGAEAAWIYGRYLAALRTLFAADTFTIDRYQLGDGNEEGIASGAWWFYYKLGFRPHHGVTRRLAAREARRVAADPGYRTSQAVLRELARHNLFLEIGRRRADVMGALWLGRVALATSAWLTARYGADREAAADECANRAAALLGTGDWRDLPAAEQMAWRWWAPLVLILPGVERWSAPDRMALAEVIRAKGGRRESDFVARFDAHARLRRALAALASSRI